MVKVNPHYSKIQRAFIFPVIEKKLAEIKKQRPQERVINLGVGDVVRPLGSVAAGAVIDAVKEMSQKAVGYGPPNGYAFLREAIATHEYKEYGIEAEEIFISEGTKGDSVYLQEIFCRSGLFSVTCPTYPSYVDGCVMEGRDRAIYMPCTVENDFCPEPPKERVSIIYLCTPNNPTGVAMSRKALERFVHYAQENACVILVDAAYAAFIHSPDVPKSIYEIEGAKQVAIEMRSFSKTAGFTGLRCAYSVVPKQVLQGEAHRLWTMRQNTKFNGVAYPVQKGALATLTGKGKEEAQKDTGYYMEQVRALRQGLAALNYEVYGGRDCPYLWWKAPEGMTSWNFFDLLLEKCLVMSIPGSGFGSSGEGFVRLSGFTTNADVNEALSRISAL